MAAIPIQEAVKSFTGRMSVEAHRSGMPREDAFDLSVSYGEMFGMFAPLLAKEVQGWKLGFRPDRKSALVMRGIAFIVREARSQRRTLVRPDLLKTTYDYFAAYAPKALPLIGDIPWPNHQPPPRPHESHGRLDPGRLP